MTIIQALKTEGVWLQFNCGEPRRMWWSELQKEWQVLAWNKQRKGFTKMICSTKDQRVAVDYLLGKR